MSERTFAQELTIAYARGFMLRIALVWLILFITTCMIQGI